MHSRRDSREAADSASEAEAVAVAEMDALETVSSPGVEGGGSRITRARRLYA